MLDLSHIVSPHLAHIVALARHVEPHALRPLAAITVARFGHEHMMPDLLHIASTDLAHVMAKARHIDPHALLYLAAATVARFWDEHVWMVYVAMAYTATVELLR